MKSLDPIASIKTKVVVTRPRHDLIDLGNAGLLWLINETVFWPRGYCLCVGLADTGEQAWWLEGDGTEPWQVSSPESAQNRFEQAKKFLESTAQHNQKEGVCR